MHKATKIQTLRGDKYVSDVKVDDKVYSAIINDNGLLVFESKIIKVSKVVEPSYIFKCKKKKGYTYIVIGKSDLLMAIYHKPSHQFYDTDNIINNRCVYVGMHNYNRMVYLHMINKKSCSIAISVAKYKNIDSYKFITDGGNVITSNDFIIKAS